jgi:dienelactone hydrolase
MREDRARLASPAALAPECPTPQQGFVRPVRLHLGLVRNPLAQPDQLEPCHTVTASSMSNRSVPRWRLYATRPWAAVFVAVLAVGFILWRAVSGYVRAASLLVRLSDPTNQSVLARVGRHTVAAHDLDSRGSRARLYLPTGVERPPGMVLVHGVHWRGIDEPRLQRFARALAESGYAVLTPEVSALCDYKVEPASIDTIGEAARVLASRLGVRRVGLMGFSFAGGLALLSASDPRYSSSIAFVVAVGAHDDLGRVLRFFVSNEALRPDGTTLQRQAHPYGPAVVLYSHVEDFFPVDDLPIARDALRSWLHEEFDAARARASALSPEAAATMKHVFDRDTAALTAVLRAEIERLEPTFVAVSPSGRLREVHVPLFLLHGAGDSVIPPSETEWIVHDASPYMVRDVLVTDAIEHVELEKNTPLAHELALLRFVRDMLHAADAWR